MTIFHLHFHSLSRAAGRSATAAAAYRAGERIRDQRTGKLHNYSRRTDVTHTEIFLPSRIGPHEATWARERVQLWNAAEAAEHQRNSRVAREYQVSLPHELNGEQRRALVRRFALELADRHQVAVDLAIHDPRPDGDPRNFHAHLLTTTREVRPEGLGAKTGLEVSYQRGRERGLAGYREMWVIRERWASLTNEALVAAGLEVRVDHRSLQEQGIDREPQPRIPYQFQQMERRGVRSEVAERIRARYRERVAARVERSRLEQQGLSADGAERSREMPGGDSVPGADVRRRARESWLALRREASGAQTPATSAAQPGRQRASAPSSERINGQDTAADEDLSL